MMFALVGCIESGAIVDGKTITKIERVRYIRILFNRYNGNLILPVNYYVHAHTLYALKLIYDVISCHPGFYFMILDIN